MRRARPRAVPLPTRRSLHWGTRGPCRLHSSLPLLLLLCPSALLAHRHDVMRPWEAGSEGFWGASRVRGWRQVLALGVCLLWQWAPRVKEGSDVPTSALRPGGEAETIVLAGSGPVDSLSLLGLWRWEWSGWTCSCRTQPWPVARVLFWFGSLSLTLARWGPAEPCIMAGFGGRSRSGGTMHRTAERPQCQWGTLKELWAVPGVRRA